ncbi:RagB/SusD family nutrient uptake outer membrane protein [Pseudobacter ginsenosidimutans]|uniref:SusD-like starch-binding protein associating with outer membrane n=1 Tax=Pseudobacter ginsenosidimutans TaxID=661488 RepID=A0A4Q7N0W4_9BACT|nr:RagB/SusD family nutrient uptake outer membrane protein [Pseudobacter ginsenosidimutans]QEC43820.1 RagB/SusD family nutrient uptake outer membrane protein [Pseudobacter ginsenosidimutans]RZS75240.1 SusD-like starch-binding protein associating with outer membrane [Pseudobacter ginsenosidimutans]
MKKYKLFSLVIWVCSSVVLFSGCKKYLDIAPPITTITTSEIFENDDQAEWAIAGMYSKMVNGTDGRPNNAANNSFAAGASTIAAGFSADDIVRSFGNDDLFRNRLLMAGNTFTQNIWLSAYKLIYDANGVIEGIQASSSEEFSKTARDQFTGEALALRAFAYFYLVNFFGDVPLPLSTDFNKTASLSRAPVTKVYDQIKTDLVKARSLLTDNFKIGKEEKIRVTKWFAEALLARVYLYTGEYQQAITSASAVIAMSDLFSIEPDLNKVFQKNSTEAILQLKQTNENSSLKNATPEGFLLYHFPNGSGTPPSFYLSEPLLNAFEANDKRKTSWTKQDGAYVSVEKYKTGQWNGVFNAVQTEYYTVMRLAELYLIRAEAQLLFSDANKDLAIADLNELRQRADVDNLPLTLSAGEVKEAIAHERQVELFAEWGHRWFDLKRTGKAAAVLSQISYKTPWYGNYQLLYPIPLNEIKYNNNLVQNPEYTQ